MERPAIDHSPTVSVLVLCYNHEAYLDQAMKSILAQDLTNVCEILVADDCSPDGSLEILKGYAANEPKIRLLTTPHNLGMQANLRRAVESVRGDFVAILEGDDYWTDPDKLTLEAAALDAHPEWTAVCHPTMEVLVDVETSVLWAKGLVGVEVLKLDDLLARVLPHASSLMYRRTALPTTPAWFGSLKGGDWPMICILASQGDIGVIRRTMSAYRRNPSSTWTPLPLIEKRLEYVRQTLAVSRNVPGCREPSQPYLDMFYALFLSTLMKTRSPRRVATVLLLVARADPREFARQLGLRLIRRPPPLAPQFVDDATA